MRLTPKNRTFQVGRRSDITLRDAGHIELEPNEQVTFTTPSGSELDVTRTSWGFYATPSLNRRMPEHNLRAALVLNGAGAMYVMAVERGCEEDFNEYVKSEESRVVAWVDTDEGIASLLGSR